MTPNCEMCVNRNDCSLLKELSEARETIFNYGREMSGRTDFIYNGQVVPAEGGGKMEKNVCFACKHASEYPVCPAASDDVIFASNGDIIVHCKAYEEVEGDNKDGV